ncbi:MAG: branched-chain amino acid ABC transporter permease [Mesorhizobium sp.]|uniref:branched-chain amino acid ABC transporter permease n=1 Tax=Mesorhizobium sp. TaxID=1871066 RepID=UPI000FE55C15|nr:branched-chain amino acid ABC transporter permease [Mesorhizobium sp.]RWI50257.1 MAG: branched-chain amino acid ABC transporter permease [Mesorhizobium sp.]
MTFWIVQALNSLSLGGLLFLLSSGFSLIFGLMRIANLSHGAFFMLGGYIGLSALRSGLNFWAAVAIGGLAVAILGGLIERLLLRRLNDRPLAQVLVTLGFTFIIADLCLMIWSGDPVRVPSPPGTAGVIRVMGAAFPLYRVAVLLIGLVVAVLLWGLIERTRLGAMIRAGVDDMAMARAVGIPASTLFSIVFALGAFLAGAGGMLGAPILSLYPGLDTDMLPLALVVVILGGVGSLAGAFVASFAIGFVYTFGQALVPDLAYVVLFLPMVLVLALRPSGLFGRQLL